MLYYLGINTWIRNSLCPLVYKQIKKLDRCIDNLKYCLLGNKVRV